MSTMRPPRAVRKRPGPPSSIVRSWRRGHVPDLFRDSGVTTLFGLSMALVIVGLVRLEQTEMLKVPVTLIGLGNASYAIYLLHNSVISLVVRVTGSLEWLGCLIVCAVIATIGGFKKGTDEGWGFVGGPHGVRPHCLPSLCCSFP